MVQVLKIRLTSADVPGTPTALNGVEAAVLPRCRILRIGAAGRNRREYPETYSRLSSESSDFLHSPAES